MAKKKIEKPSMDNAVLMATIAAIDKEYGKGTLRQIGELSDVYQFPYQISTGSIGLDVIIGPAKRLETGKWQRGLAPGRIVEIYGPESSGKSTLCQYICGHAQRQGYMVGYLDMEHTFDPMWGQRCGMSFDDKKFFMATPDNGEQCLSILEMLIKSKQFGVLVVDSVAALVPQAELEGDMGDSFMGVQARLISQALRKINPLLGEGNNTTVIFTNQIREKIGVVFGNPETTPGGRAMKFYASVRIEMRKKDKHKDGDKIVGIDLLAKVIKSKLCAPFGEATIPLSFDRGIDWAQELVDMAIKHGVVAAEGAYYPFAGERFHGYDAFVAGVRSKSNIEKVTKPLYDATMVAAVSARGFSPEGINNSNDDDEAATMEGVGLTVQHEETPA